MDHWMIIVGLMAAVFTAASQLPQMILVIRTNNTSGLSILTYSMLAIGVASWAIYGVMRNDWTLIVANSLVLIMVLVILFYMLKNGIK